MKMDLYTRNLQRVNVEMFSEKPSRVIVEDFKTLEQAESLKHPSTSISEVEPRAGKHRQLLSARFN